ncbi:hypothetical protein Cgig2_007281 [Carnegiea gigantea]|uniref:Gnk2-homologous domain-containing protein n=1 Tax=Carnegiea gigantea TaxID=171969 RepID=A0A9Q1QQQ6_9CARY|nr:hypothetical protein Cgig2_007281 [Carnegiea gigantea]
MSWAGATHLVEPRIDGSKLVEQHHLFYGFSGWGIVVVSSGPGNNTVYGLAQCWGVPDIIKQRCYPGIQGAVQKLLKSCPRSTDAQIWCDYCSVRYSLDNFFGAFDASKYALVKNMANYKDPKSLFSNLGPLFENIIRKIADPAYSGIARAQIDLPGGDTLYGGAQCTADLRPPECSRCVDAAIKNFDNFCKPRQGCRVYLSSCLARHEVFNFSFPLTLGSRKSMMISSL